MRTAYAFVGMSVVIYILTTLTLMSASVTVAIAEKHPMLMGSSRHHKVVQHKPVVQQLEKPKIVHRAGWRKH